MSFKIVKIANNKILSHQIKFYAICGAISTSFDFILYFSLFKLGVNLDVAKGISFLSATLISYFLNKHITFKTKVRSWIKLFNFFIVHVGTMLIDVALNKAFLHMFTALSIKHNLCLIFAFVSATFFSVIANFLCQKYWVFR